MPRKYRLELNIALDAGSELLAVESARRHYDAGGAVTVEEGDAPRRLLATEFISNVERALAELAERNPLFEEAQVEMEGIGCNEILQDERGLSGTTKSSDLPSRVAGGSRLYLCRWPNGDFSLVKAVDRKEAVVRLDEWAGAEPSWLVPIAGCMIDFRLTDCGGIELSQFGAQTAEFIWSRCYPALDKVLSGEDNLNQTPGVRAPEMAERIRIAVDHERRRLWGRMGPTTAAKTRAGRELQERLGTVGPVADHYVGLVARQLLRRKTSRNGKKRKPS